MADHFLNGHRRIFKTSDREQLLERSYYFLMTKDEQFLKEMQDEIGDLPDYLRRPRQVPM